MSSKTATGFPLLSETFVSCYRDFDRYFQTWRRENPANEQCYLMFGASGAGKSTLMARLLSNDDPETFVNYLKADDVMGFTMIGDVKVGHTPLKSTTLIPRGHRVNGMNIFDMPGFQDFDADRRIIISILHKCLLTRLKAVKFVVVLGIEALKTKVPARGILDYCDAFQEMFGDKFSAYMEHVYFVLTKNDQVGMTEQEVKMSLFDMMMGAGSLGRASVSMFITRLMQHHIIIDHSRYSADETREQITEMLRRGQLANSEGVVSDALNINTLEAQENELTAKCSEELFRLAKTITDSDEEFKKERDRAMTDLAGLQRTAEGHIAGHMRLVHDASAKYAELATITDALATYSMRREKVHGEVVRHSTQMKFCNDQLSYLQVSVAGFENVNVRCDVGKLEQGWTKKMCVVRNTIPVTGGRDVVLVTRYEENDTTLRSHIASIEQWPATQQPLIPKHLSTIESFKHDIVLYHSQKAINKAPSDIKIASDNKYINIDIQLEYPFKVYVFYSTPFSNSVAYHGLRKQFDTKLADATARACEAELEETRLDNGNQDNIKRKAELLQMHKAFVTRILDSREVLANQGTGVEATGTSKLNTLQQFLAFANPESYASLLNVEAISDIYTANKLKTDLVARTVELRGRLDNLRKGISSATAELRNETARAHGVVQAAILTAPTIPEGLSLPHHNN